MGSQIHGMGNSERALKRSVSGLLVLGLLASACLLALAPSNANAAGTGSISGVLEIGPIEGIFPSPIPCVEAYDSAGNQVARADIDSDGNYKVVGLESGDYRLKFNDCDMRIGPNPDYNCTGAAVLHCVLPGLPSEYYDNKWTLAEATPVSVTDGVETTGINASLSGSESELFRAGSGTISGKLTNTSDQPLEGVCVTSYDSSGKRGETTESDSDGEYVLSGFDTANYRIKFFYCGGANVLSEFYDDEPTLDDATPVSATEGADTPDIDAELATAGSFSGRVTYGSGPYYYSACVFAIGSDDQYIVGSPAETDENGYYTFKGLETGDYRVRFSYCGGGGNFFSEFYPDMADVNEATPISVTAGSVTPNIDANLPTGGSIAGTIDGGPGFPGEGCSVEVIAYDQSGFPVSSDDVNTTAEGKAGYEILLLRTGSYKVGFAPKCVPNAPIELLQPVAFYDGVKTIEQAAPVSVTEGSPTTGIDFAKDPPKPPPVYKAKIGGVKVTGPAQGKRGKKVTFRVAITNTGDADATGVGVKVTGKGVSAKATAGKIGPGVTKTVKINLKPKKKGKPKLTFKVTSSNAGNKSIARRITVTK